MDAFNSKSIFYKSGPYDNLADKTFGRRYARRSSKQNSAQWFQEYEDSIYPMDDWLDYIWDNDYDYWDMLDIYNDYTNYYFDSLENNIDPGFSFQ